MHLFKDGLVKELTEAIELSQTTKSTMKFASTGRFMDEEDLREKYKNKPDQLEQIFQNARSMKHPDRQVTLWEDRDFTLDLANEEERAEKKRRLLESEEKIKAPKVAAKKGAKPAAAAGAAHASDHVSMTKGQKTKTQKFIQRIEGELTKCMTQQSTISATEYTDLIPTFQKTKLTSTITDLEKHKDKLEELLANEGGKREDVGNLKKDLTELLDAAQGVSEKMKGRAILVSNSAAHKLICICGTLLNRWMHMYIHTYMYGTKPTCTNASAMRAYVLAYVHM